jgi:hypothetical protein
MGKTFCMPDNAIISFANHRGNYLLAMHRLESSLQNNFNGKFIGFTGEASIGAPLHTDNPYAFKVYAFKKALELGYKKILYLDSSVYVVANVQPAFDLIERDGVLFQEAGHYIKSWVNENCLNYFGYKREDFGDAVMHGNAGLCGINFNNQKGAYFFHAWESAMLSGAFKGSWSDFRHDMTCASVIAWQMDLQKYYVSGNELLEYAAPEDPIKNNTIIFKAQGL